MTMKNNITPCVNLRRATHELPCSMIVNVQTNEDSRDFLHFVGASIESMDLYFAMLCTSIV